MKIQRYEESVSPNPMPNVRQTPNATAESLGGGKAKQIQALGAGLQSVGEGVSKIAGVYSARSQDRKDKALVRDALNRAESDMRLYEGEMVRPENREKALDAYSVSQKALTEMRKKFSNEFKNDRQRELFVASFDANMNGLLDRSYALQEKTRLEFEKLTRDAQNQSAVENAVAARTDPKAIQESEITIVANTNASTVGLPKEARKSASDAAIHNLHASVVSALTQDDPRAAKGYMELNKAKFNPKAYETMKAEVDEKAFDWEVRTMAADIVNAGLTEDQIDERISSVDDPKKADALRTRVKEKLEDRKVAREIQSKENLHTSWQQVLRGGPIPYGRLSGTEVKAMETYERARLRGFSQTSDSVTLMSLGRLTDQELKEVDEVTMAGYARVLRKDDFDAIFTRYRDLRREAQVGMEPDKLSQIRTDSAMVVDALASLGVDPDISKNRGAKKAKETAGEKILINELTGAFQRQINAEEKAKGRKLAPEEKQQLLDDLLIKGKVRGKNTFLFQADDADINEKNFDLKNIPLDLQQMMQEAFRMRNIPATPENIKNYYLEYLRRRNK